MPQKGQYKENLVGRVFGRLTVIRHYSKYINGISEPYCDCKCECGNDYACSARVLKRKKNPTRSCGCMGGRRKDLSGMTFGKWTVIGLGKTMPKGDGRKKPVTTWICQCSCKDKTIREVMSANLLSGISTSCGCHKNEMFEKFKEEHKEENHPCWKGGVAKYKISRYDTYVPQLEPIEECRRDPNNYDLLQVRCYYCKEWISPTLTQTMTRAKSIDGRIAGENHFYCLDKDCKNQCSIFGQHKFPRGYKPDSNRPYVDPYWREQVLANADYKCEICGSEDDLEAHHIQSATLNPMLANDIDNGICCCSQCHYDIIHSQPGCRPIDLQCNSPE